jgi:hypothetical protein
VVGATQHNFGRGGAYIFQRVNGLWSQTADLTLPGLQFGDSYGNAVGQWAETAELQPRQQAGQLDLGTSVSMSRDGSVALAGANVYKDAVGAAYVFRYTSGRWTQRAMLTAGPQAQAGAYFGTSVALDATGRRRVRSGVRRARPGHVPMPAAGLLTARSRAGGRARPSERIAPGHRVPYRGRRGVSRPAGSVGLARPAGGPARISTNL